MNRKFWHLILTAAVFAAFTVSYLLFLQTPWFHQFFAWSQQNLFLFIGVLFILKVMGNVYPPLPGGMLTLAAIPFLGWPLAYGIDFIGSFVSAIICYYLGMKYGQKILLMVFDETVIAKISRLKMKPGKEIEGIIVTRLLTGGTLVEALYYGAGFLKINFSKFLIGTVISHVIAGIPTYYLGEQLFSSRNILLNGVFIIIALLFLYKLKGRYFA